MTRRNREYLLSLSERPRVMLHLDTVLNELQFRIQKKTFFEVL
jgi:hypothetical protein